MTGTVRLVERAKHPRILCLVSAKRMTKAKHVGRPESPPIPRLARSRNRVQHSSIKFDTMHVSGSKVC